VTIGLDDSTPGQVYVYVGDKTNSGNAVDRAGFTNGQLYGVRVSGIPDETRETGIPSGTPFELFNFGNVENQTGAYLQATSEIAGVTEFLRPEDGAWDPRNPNDFYFVTTDRFDQVKAGTGAQIGRSRLYRLRFVDVTRPELGGTVDMLLDGTEPQQMMDNLDMDAYGRVLIQEDPGNQPYLARIWEYDVKTDTMTEVAVHDPNRFAPGAPGLLTTDEESSGIIDVSDIFGPGYYIFDVQAHRALADPELVEDGQLLLMFDPLRKEGPRSLKAAKPETASAVQTDREHMFSVGLFLSVVPGYVTNRMNLCSLWNKFESIAVEANDSDQWSCSHSTLKRN
jgi:hypothetical protein